jgi:hypothetical protein
MTPPKKHIAKNATTTASRPAAVGLKSLAEHLGLSVASISRVLSGAPAAKSIPEVTQKRILAAAAEMNYRPNVLARCWSPTTFTFW